MPKQIPPLSDAACRALRYDRANTKVVRIRDGGGLYLEALPSGRKVWRLEYRTLRGTKTRASLSPDYGTQGGSLADARKWREELRLKVASGIDPNRTPKEISSKSAERSFNSAADEWLDFKSSAWSAATEKKVRSIVRRVLQSGLGELDIADITSANIQDVLHKFDSKGQTETAHRGCEYASAIFRRAMLRGLVNGDPARPVRDTLRPNTHRNHSHLTDPKAIGQLMRAVDGYEGHPSVVFSIKILPRVFTRPGELRLATWDEFDLEQGEWLIPESRMKARREHMVPLSHQVVELLRTLEDYSPNVPGGLLFPSIRSDEKPITDSTVRAALRVMGFTNEEITPHGFRHTASTQLHELGWETHIIERQLAHMDSNAIRGVYNKAEYWSKRCEMMQAWADYLDELKGKF